MVSRVGTRRGGGGAARKRAAPCCCSQPAVLPLVRRGSRARGVPRASPAVAMSLKGMPTTSLAPSRRYSCLRGRRGGGGGGGGGAGRSRGRRGGVRHSSGGRHTAQGGSTRRPSRAALAEPPLHPTLPASCPCSTPTHAQHPTPVTPPPFPPPPSLWLQQFLGVDHREDGAVAVQQRRHVNLVGGAGLGQAADAVRGGGGGHGAVVGAEWKGAAVEAGGPASQPQRC